MRVLIDYRPALRHRSGVGEYVHGLARGLIARSPTGDGEPVRLTIFSSSWRDRLAGEVELDRARLVDAHIPVRVLNLLWHRLEWPPIELLTGERFDVVHSPHPLLLPTRDAAQVVTIHDLDFLTYPERTGAEIRRDYPRLAGPHARRADHVVVNSKFTAGEVERRLEIPRDKISVCTPGAPEWPPRSHPRPEGYLLFFGTLEPRKNVGRLLDAYERLLAGSGTEHLPDLVLAGRTTPAGQTWIERIGRPPLAGRVRHLGYIDPAGRRALYEGATLLVQPSLEEGFGLPVLEAMSVGVPVVAANRGALPEVLGGAGLLIDPEDSASIAAAIARLLTDEALASSCASNGVLRAQQFTWRSGADALYNAYQLAIDHRRSACASA